MDMAFVVDRLFVKGGSVILGYLASPYTHPDPKVREKRYLAAMDVVRDALLEGVETLFSPIVHSHPVGERFGLPQEWDFWRRADFPFIERCDRLYVLALPGWETSVGVAAEVEHARALGKPVLTISSWGVAYGGGMRGGA